MGELRKGVDENINNIMTANISINENFNGLHIKSEETRKVLDDLMIRHSTDVDDLIKNITSNTSMIEDLNEKIKDVDDKAIKNYTFIQNIQDSSVKNMKSIEATLKGLDDGNRANSEKIISIQETTIIQAEKIQEINKLNDETRKQDETKIKEELEKITNNNMQTLKALDDVKNNQKEDVTMLTKNIEYEKERINNIEEEMKELDDTVTRITTDVVKNTNHLQELENAKILHGSSIDETKLLIQEIDSKLK